MTLIERLRQECDILRLMQQEHLRLASHSLYMWNQTENSRHLTTAIKAQHRWEFNEEKIEWLEKLLREYEE